MKGRHPSDVRLIHGRCIVASGRAGEFIQRLFVKGTQNGGTIRKTPDSKVPKTASGPADRL